MRTSVIHKALSNHPLTKSTFGGVFARNRVPPIPNNKTVFYVINTHPHYKPGEHWIVFYLTPTTVFFFDPYGLPVRKGFKRLLKARGCRKFFNQRLQGKGRTCGHHCLYFILTRRSNQSLNIFGNDFDANDKVVKQLVRKHFLVM